MYFLLKVRPFLGGTFVSFPGCISRWFHHWSQVSSTSFAAVSKDTELGIWLSCLFGRRFFPAGAQRFCKTTWSDVNQRHGGNHGWSHVVHDSLILQPGTPNSNQLKQRNIWHFDVYKKSGDLNSWPTHRHESQGGFCWMMHLPLTTFISTGWSMFFRLIFKGGWLVPSW